MTIHGPLPANKRQKSLDPPNGEVQKAKYIQQCYAIDNR